MTQLRRGCNESGRSSSPVPNEPRCAPAGVEGVRHILITGPALPNEIPLHVGISFSRRLDERRNGSNVSQQALRSSERDTVIKKLNSLKSRIMWKVTAKRCMGRVAALSFMRPLFESITSLPSLIYLK